jgi:purine-nucleoside phosphorylase
MGKGSFKKYNEAADYIRSRYATPPSIGIILGSGLGSFIDEIKIETEIPYSEIPHFPVTTVEGHGNKLVLGKLAGRNVAVMSGRFHFYEGYGEKEVIFPVRVMKLLGVETLMLSNAAGAVNPEYRVGDIMMIRDHISFFIPNPLIGKNKDEFGPRFPDMSQPYSKNLRVKARTIASVHGYNVWEGVYVAVTGPTFETPAEYQFIRGMGADVVGMSTVQECIAARHADMEVFAMSVVTDIGLRTDGLTTTHEEVLEAARQAEPRMAVIFRELAASI